MGSFNIHPDFQNEFSYATSPLDPEEFRRQGHMVIGYLADYYQNIEKYPVRSQVEPNYLRSHLPDSAPCNPEPIENILRDLQKHIIPGLTHWQSPSHFALFPCATSTAGFLGEVLSTGFNVVGFDWISSPAATELENIVMDWFGKLLKLPGSFLFSGGGGGVLQGTTYEAMLSTLAAARDQMLRKIGRNNIGKLVVYLSDQTHFSFQKAAQIAGINPSNFRVISTTKDDEFSLCPNSVRSAIIADVEGGLVPLYLCATVGTTLSTAVDPLGPICNIAEEYDMWVHVDAAYAGSACICPEFRHFLDGALSTKPEILRNQATDSKQVVDYKDWQISLSRRFRALKLWLVLRSYGVVNLQKFIRGHVNMAKHFEQLAAMNKRFEIVVPRKFSLVCFRISPSAMNQNCKILSTEEDVNLINQKLVESLNASGHVYMTHGVIGGIYFIKFAIRGPLTDYRHVDMAWTLIEDHAEALLKAS
ncbi:unnamed protein product [Coffea canephora]|uniref:Tyrosine decarboxylase n=1 Tax=Coffea canephora TaxID=49390 RepID=A0A068UAK9_COFCA|nr:unnamed protein product [Coffea canephora]